MDSHTRRAVAKKLYKNRLRECRMASRLTQSELAQRTNLSQPMISAIENERMFLSSFDALLIANEIGCSLDDLYEKR